MEAKFRKTPQFILALIVAVRLVFPYVIIAQTVEGNNSESQNLTSETTSNTQNINQTNDASVGSSVNVSLSTGGNTVSSSTGNSTINTGDTSFSTSVVTSANTSVVDSDCCPTVTPEPTKISDNNSDSTNTISTTSETITEIDIDQNATVTNKINVTLSTGGNTISDSTGSSTIVSGDVKVRGEINNGPINYADVAVGNPGANVSTVISNNNSGSTNTIYNSSINKSYDIDINNTAKVKNLLSFILDSGNNSIEGGTGSAKISTGDIFFVFKIDNATNVSKVTYACCGDGCPDPATPTPTATLTPTPTPSSAIGGPPTTTTTNNGDNDNDDDNNGGGGGSVEQRVASMVLGATGSFMENLFYVFFALGAILIGLGIRKNGIRAFGLLGMGFAEKTKSISRLLIESQVELIFVA